MVLKLPKIMHFLQFCTTVSKISDSFTKTFLIATFLIAKFLKAAILRQLSFVKMIQYTLSENSMVYRVGGFWGTVHETLKYKKPADSAEKFLKANSAVTKAIFWTVNHRIVKSAMRTLRCIYINCCRRLRFLAAISTKLKTIHLFLLIHYFS